MSYINRKYKPQLVFPHCLPSILHDPNLDDCEYCNALPEWQALRQAWGIAFTGHSNEVETFYNHATGKDEQRLLIPCPSERGRTVNDIHRWHGNRPQATIVGPSIKSGHRHPDGTKPVTPQCTSMHGNQQCQWKVGHTGPHQECNECWIHD